MNYSREVIKINKPHENQEEENLIIKVEVKLNHQLFPRYPRQIQDGDWGIVKWTVMEAFEGEPKTDMQDRITVLGTYQEIEPNETYVITAKKTEPHPTFGEQYELLFMCQPTTLTSVAHQKVFLKNILTENQIEKLFEIFESPVDIIANHDIDGLMRVKGMGAYTAKQIIKKYEATKDYSQAYIELDKYGLTPKMIHKLVNRYRSPQTAIIKVKENPYILATEVEGIGFSKADKIALGGGMDIHEPKRIEAFIIYILNSEALKGNSFLYSGDLTQKIFNEFGKNIIKKYESGENNIALAVENLIKKEILLLWDSEIINQKTKKPDKRFKKMALKKYYSLEDKVAKHLIRILKNRSENTDTNHNWKEKIKEIEEKQGWKFTREQLEGIEMGLENSLMVITGKAGCVDADTEYFNGSEWKKISNFKHGEKVLQYHKDGTATLTPPQRYIKEKCNNFYLMQNMKKSIYQVLSIDHDVVYLSSRGNLNKKSLREVMESHNGKDLGFSGKFLTHFHYDGEGLDFSDNMIKLLVAFIADGSIMKNNSKYNCRFGLKKERKKERIRTLLKNAGVEYTETKALKKGYINIYTNIPLKNKYFDKKWYKCSNKQMQIICNEAPHWDGCFLDNGRVMFSSNDLRNLNFMQFAYSSIGKRAIISFNNRKGQTHTVNSKEYIRKSIDGNLYISKNSNISLRARRKENKINIEKINASDGFKYCFTVPSGMLVLRKEGRIFITGNCGKTSTVTGILKASGALDGKRSFAQTSLSGKAASRMQEVSGQEGYTIHRLLGYNPIEGFAHDDLAPLWHDDIILDEFSMPGGYIFYKLIKAIANGSKLILMGDHGQLEAIGTMNIAKDLTFSDIVPTVNLTKIHRQAAKSGIILFSRDIDAGIQTFEKGYEGMMVLGELQDCIVDVYKYKDKIAEKVLEYYKEYYPTVDSVMDIQVLAPVKERGDASVYYLNNAIQEFVNPPSDCKEEIEINTGEKKNNKKFTIREQDKIMVLQNKKDMVTVNDEKVRIYNGWTGIVKEIDWKQRAHVYFPIIKDTVIIPKGDLKNCKLGYAGTVHKYQGSEAKIIIGAIDYCTPPKMLTRELAYTMATRAQKKLIMVVQNSAFRQCVETTGVMTKNTFLPERLEHYFKIWEEQKIGEKMEEDVEQRKRAMEELVANDMGNPFI